jgi:CysZ protein
MADEHPDSGAFNTGRDVASAFLRGFVSPGRAARLLLTTRGLKRWAIAPLVANTILFILILVLCLSWLVPALDVSGLSPDWAGAFGESVFNLLKWVVFLALLFVFFFFGFTAVGMVLASPFNDVLSEKVEKTLCGATGEGGLSWVTWIRATLFSVWESLKIALQQLFFSLLTLPFLLVPVVGAVPLFLVNAYFGGLGFLDVALARHFLGAKHRRAGLEGLGWEIFGLGAAMTFLLAIPVLNLFILPLGVVAATMLYSEIDWQARLQAHGVQPPPGYVPPMRRESAEAPVA